MWIVSLKAGLVLLEIVEFGIPILFWLDPIMGVALNWIFHLAVGAAAYDFSASMSFDTLYEHAYYSAKDSIRVLTCIL